MFKTQYEGNGHGNHGNSSPEFLGLKENMYESNSCGTMGLFHPLIIQI